MDIRAIAQNFVDYYNQLFNPHQLPDGTWQLDRDQLVQLYMPESLFTGNTAELVGSADIMRYLCSDGLSQVRKLSNTVSVQPTMQGMALLVIAQGVMHITFEEENEISYVDAFVLVPDATGESWFIANHVQSTHGS
jgi:hypothetical protein